MLRESYVFPAICEFGQPQTKTTRCRRDRAGARHRAELCSNKSGGSTRQRAPGNISGISYPVEPLLAVDLSSMFKLAKALPFTHVLNKNVKNAAPIRCSVHPWHL